MPLVDIEVIEGVCDSGQKARMIQKVTDAMVEVEGEAMRGVTWVWVKDGAQRAVGHRRQHPECRRHQGNGRGLSETAGRVQWRIPPRALFHWRSRATQKWPAPRQYRRRRPSRSPRGTAARRPHLSCSSPRARAAS